MTLETVLLFFFSLYILKILYKQCSIMYYCHQLPGPPKHSIIFGNMKPLHDTPDKIFQVVRKFSREYLQTYKLWAGPLVAINIVDPEDTGVVLSDMNHNRKSFAYTLLHKWLAFGLLTSDGDKWIQRRKLLTPAFHFTILQEFILSFNENTEELVNILKKEQNKPYTEINDLITSYTLKVIGETAMGKKMNFSNKNEKIYKKTLHKLCQLWIYRLFRPYLVFNVIYVFFPTYWKEVKLVKILHDFTKEVIADREDSFHQTKKKRMAMLDLLLTAKNEKKIIDDAGIREEVDTFMFEGHDTVSSAIIFGLMLLANHPAVQEEIVQEMREILGDIKKKPDYRDLQELKYMDRCIKEILRLYPSVPYISRSLGKDIVTHSGYKIKKDTTAQLHIFDLHRNPVVFPNPEKFDPDRFLPENCKDRHPYAYIPFSAGPRNCIGQRFAVLEIKSVFCGILGNFILEVVDKPESVICVIDIILRSQNNIKVKFVRRQD